MKKKSILYLTYTPHHDTSASALNSTRRMLAMQQAGYHVTAAVYDPTKALESLKHIALGLRSADYLVIRIDGSGLLDKFTLLKCMSIHLKIVWEIHGFPEENYNLNFPEPSRFRQFISTATQRLLSLLVDGSITVSRELEQYARTKINLGKTFLIPNFVIPEEFITPATYAPAMHPVLTNQKSFFVLWGGNARLRWHAIDIIERVAKKIAKRDASIIFFLVGSNSWHSVQKQTNILQLPTLPRNEFLSLIKRTHVCLALYHKPKLAPFYFSPLKILDYMMHKKAVIASSQKSIEALVVDKKNGLTTDNSVEDVAQKILFLKQRSSLAAKLGLNAQKTIQSFHTIKYAANQYKHALNSIAQKQRL